MKSLATFSWKTLLAESNGTAVSDNKAFDKAPIETDTRTIEPGSFFLPISGGNFDGNAYIAQAYEKGAIGAFVQVDYFKAHPELKQYSNLIAVEDTLLAYHAIARYWRHFCKAKIVAITGSSGKTTTKEMLAALLIKAFGEQYVQKTEKNYNNEVGVPLTLLNLDPKTEVLVLEMGMRGLDQIALLSKCAEPDIGLISNIGPAHIGILGSLESICQAKCEIFIGMDPQKGIGVVNADDALLMRGVSKYWKGDAKTFSLKDAASIKMLPEGKTSFQYNGIEFVVGVPGNHNVLNALSGIKVCEALGIPVEKIKDGLKEFTAGGERWQQSELDKSKNLWLINDAYNANPQSMQAALSTFADTDFKGLKKVAVLGVMAELGDMSKQFHAELGTWLATQTGLEGILVVGEEAFPIADSLSKSQSKTKTFTAKNTDEAAAMLLKQWPDNTMFLLKASRSAKLEAIPELLSQKKTVLK